jgi:hypothetical protein
MSEWKKSVELSNETYHVDSGASDACTGYIQNILQEFRSVQLGETTLTGHVKFAIFNFQLWLVVARQVNVEAICRT